MNAALLKSTPTKAGAMDYKMTMPTNEQNDKAAVMDAIDEMFGKFELVYHNQYTKAFPSEEKLIFAKKLWFSHLSHLSPRQIIFATDRAIKESEFLPTVKGILKYCDDALGLPDAHQAYIEACNAASPKLENSWSHPAVYLAGQQSDWFFLASNAEAKAFPIFKEHYEALCQRVIRGEQLSLPETKALPETISTPLTNEQRKERMKSLREELKI